MASQDCQVCLERFDNAERRPRCLSCGHTLCTSCLTDILGRGQLLCPFCRLPHNGTVQSVDDVPINYTVVSLLEDPAFSLATQRDQALLVELKREASELNTEHLVTLNCHLTRLRDFQQKLSNQCVIHQNQLQALQALVGRHESLLEAMVSTSNEVAARIDEGEGTRTTLEAAQEQVNSASSLLEVAQVHQDHDGRSVMVQGWVAKAQDVLGSQALSRAKEIEIVTCSALEAAVERNTAGAAANFSPRKGRYSDFDDIPKFLSEILKAASLVGSDVWAVHNEEGRSRCAKVTLLDGYLLLHSLREGTPPVYTHKVEYLDVRNMVDRTCMRTFLEFSWNGQVQGRLIIKLANLAPRTRQFFYLCSGERGPSYANTRLLEVENRGRPGERIWGGDYEMDNGTGGAPLPGLTMGDLNAQSVTAGLVAGFCYANDHKPAHFTIYNNDHPIAYEECPIGQVEHGLDVACRAAKLTNIQDAVVSDSGIVFPLSV
ncbi:E3 ubiquitin-protein ligase TRIM32-like [Macrobrachium rosenbergii]|uniref:E3 ubiquitin-protein ligase TRIM32-like n=1 Tax=Macrobrachium rosenbergii TaxID=79674 RepID=UPI0034D5B2DA